MTAVTALRATRCTRPPRPPVPTPAQILRAEISELGRQIDRRLGNRPGAAERAIYFWLWPPPDVQCLDTLTRLHADAVEFLGAVTADPAHTPKGITP